MHKRNPKVAVVQMDCKLGDVEWNLATIEALARRVGRREADIVCFPELATTGYSLNRRWRDYSETIPGPTSNRLARLAREFGFYLICGIAERDSESRRIFDSAVLISPAGNCVGVYRKIHLWATERRFFTPGRRFPVFRTKFGKIGIGICYDLEFPEPARAMALQGAEIIFFSSAQPSPMENHVDTYVRSRAAENCVFVAHSNRIGREGRMVFFGQSQIVSPTCRVLARKDAGQGFAVARVDFRSSRRMRKTLPYLQQRVPSAYSALVR
ncbi:MAG: carbon-nitrogen hydrolase family protein [Candidatus Bathyarchaeia archaeon]|jgi:predicted amidohydrolase